MVASSPEDAKAMLEDLMEAAARVGLKIPSGCSKTKVKGKTKVLRGRMAKDDAKEAKELQIQGQTFQVLPEGEEQNT